MRLSAGSLVVTGVLVLARMLNAEPSAAVGAGSDSSFGTVDAYVEGQLRRLNTPGAILAIVEGDRVVHRRSFGKARPRGEAPSPQTPFFIGSLTKSFTALAVMQLVEAGTVELDTPVRHYLPWFRLADSGASARITVRHLLNQTSGLPSLLGELNLLDFDSSPGAEERQARALAKAKLSHPAGSKCEYSNLNYNVLGLIVEAASGQPYEAYVQEHIFDPLEMRHSYTSKSLALQNGLAVGHRYWFAHPVAVTNLPVPQGSLPSGQLISCAEDMSHYLIAHLNGGRYGGVQVLSNAGIEELHRGAAEYVVMRISSGSYAMGWFDTDLGGVRAVYHAGNVPDFSGFMVLLPEQNKAAVLLANADHYGLPPVMAEVGLGMTAVLAGRRPGPARMGFIPWVMRMLPLIPMLQIVGVILTIWTLSRWNHDPSLLPGAGRLWGLFLILPLVPNLALVGALAYLKLSGLLRFLRLFTPDVALIVGISGTFAGIWAILRTGLTLGVWHKLHP
jgi:CubicO group peptidase (beta-lactamase class C family)